MATSLLRDTKEKQHTICSYTIYVNSYTLCHLKFRNDEIKSW